MSVLATRPRLNKNTLVLILVAIALMTTAVVAVFRYLRCDYLSETPVWSPDGKWVVKSTTRACPAGLLSVTNCDVFVAVNAGTGAGPNAASPVPIFESDGTAEPPSVSWTSASVVKLKIKEEGTVSTSRHEVGNIRIESVVPMWIWNSLGAIESDRLRDDRESEELFKAGKMTSGDLRGSLETTAAVAAERTRFRQWVVDNATVEGVLPADAQSRK